MKYTKIITLHLALLAFSLYASDRIGESINTTPTGQSVGLTENGQEGISENNGVVNQNNAAQYNPVVVGGVVPAFPIINPNGMAEGGQTLQVQNNQPDGSQNKTYQFQHNNPAYQGSQNTGYQAKTRGWSGKWKVPKLTAYQKDAEDKNLAMRAATVFNDVKHDIKDLYRATKQGVASAFNNPGYLENDMRAAERFAGKAIQNIVPQGSAISLAPGIVMPQAQSQAHGLGGAPQAGYMVQNSTGIWFFPKDHGSPTLIKNHGEPQEQNQVMPNNQLFGF